MIQTVPQVRVFVATEPVDFRKGIDGLCRICRAVLDKDPFSGYMFLFTNRKRVGVKILVYDGQGFWLCYKRLSKGKMSWWPSTEGGNSQEINSWGLQSLLSNIKPDSSKFKEFRKVKQP
jgi:hypothetical protein